MTSPARRFLQAATRKIAPIATKTAVATTIIDARKNVAAEIEIPIPVSAAAYAATHTGHFGTSASTAVGTIQPSSVAIRRRGFDSAF